MNLSVKKGYLKSVHRYVHIKDQNHSEFESHHHDFCKIVIFISGKVDYIVEGKTYRLRPWDILLVNQFQIHQPIIDCSEEYERIVIWINPVAIESFSTEEFDVLRVFSEMNKTGSSLIRLPIPELEKVREVLDSIEQYNNGDDITKSVVTNLLTVQLLVFLFQKWADGSCRTSRNDITYDKMIMNVIYYIQKHIDEELTVEQVSDHFYTSKYNLMRKFKQQTGMTMHQYILQKRLLVSKSLMKERLSMTEVCLQSGFSDYTTFYRTFKKEYGVSPRAYAKQYQSDWLFELTNDKT